MTTEGTDKSISVEASLSIRLHVECPHCDSYIDMLDYDNGYNDEGEVIQELFPKSEEWVNREMKMDICCPECDKEISVEGVEW